MIDRFSTACFLLMVLAFIAMIPTCALVEANKSIECIKGGGEWRLNACRNTLQRDGVR